MNLGPNERSNEERILDANLNRSTEALRVVEEIARLGMSDKSLSEGLKKLRHQLLGVLAPDPETRLKQIEKRDILGDVGCEIASPSAPGNQNQTGLQELVLRNFQRLKESLRTIEEVLKLSSPDLSRVVQSLRYRAYNLEKELLVLLSEGKSTRLRDAALYLLWTPSLCTTDPESILKGALVGGVCCVQLRLKNTPVSQWLHYGEVARALTREYQVPLIVNDRADICLALEADGLHVGQDDLPIPTARSIIGKERLLGLSTHSLEQAEQALEQEIDYIGIGPTFETQTKDAGPALGADKCAEIFNQISIPAFAIGGINADKLGRLLGSGVHRIAVSSAILSASSEREATERTETLKSLLSSPARAE